MSGPLKVFITYSHKDPQQNTELKTRLAVMEDEGKITLWDDNEILAGDEWYKDISNNLADSDILLYLVSATSLASKNCNKELAEALSAKIRVIPIILERCDWLNHKLSNFQALPDKGEPINEWAPESRGWQDVVEGIRKVVDKMQTQADSSSRTSEKELRTELAFQQGNVFMMLGQINRAIERYSHAIELDSNNAEAYNNRGIAYGNIGDFGRAIADLTEAIQQQPDYAAAYNNRGNAYRAIGDLNRAIADYNMVIKKEPSCAEVYYNRGIAWLRLEEWDKARSDLTQAENMGVNIINVFGNGYESVLHFEAINKVKVPEDIAEMLTPRQ